MSKHFFFPLEYLKMDYFPEIDEKPVDIYKK